MAGGETGVLQVAADLAIMRLHGLADGGFVFRFLAQDRLADHTFDIGVRELDAHGKAGLKALEAGRGVQRGLAGPDEEQALIQLGAAMLGDLLDIHRPRNPLADELLDFVHDEQSAGQGAFLAKNLPEEVECQAHGGRGNLGKASPDCLLDVRHRAVFRVGRQEGLGKGDRIIQVRDFFEQVAVVPGQRLGDQGFQTG